jgi:hypothetical protein
MSSSVALAVYLFLFTPRGKKWIDDLNGIEHPEDDDE